MGLVVYSFSFKIRLKRREITNTPATGLFAKIPPIKDGNAEKNSGSTMVTPIPMQKERATMVMFLSLNPHPETILQPLNTIEPNIIIVHPPKTASGRELKNAPIGGNKDARINTKAPIKMVKRFTTFVIATSPTF